MSAVLEMIIERLTPNAFITASRLVAMGASAFSLTRALSREEEFKPVVESMVIAVLAIEFHGEFLKGLMQISNLLTAKIASLNPQETLLEFVAKALTDAAHKFSITQKSHSNSFISSAENASSALAQVFRVGVWGVVTSLIEYVFLMLRYVFQVCHDVCLQILYVLLPFGAAIYPLAPRILANLLCFAIEIALWFPVFAIINVTTALIAKHYVFSKNDIGFFILAVEIVAIILIVSVPAVTHKIVSGSLSLDGGALKLMMGAKRWIGK